MHNLTKIRLFRILFWITYPISFIILYPFIFINRKKDKKLYFFFDRYAIGGAQRVHLDILDSVKDTPKIVYFTRKSPNDKLKHEFYSKPHTVCHDIHFWCDNLLLRLFSVHYFSFLVSNSPSGKVLGSNSTFFYDMLPFISKKIKKFELLHNFSYGKRGMEFFGLANYRYLDKRLVIDQATHDNILSQYRQQSIDPSFCRRVTVVEFGVQIPHTFNKPEVPPLRILYAGRGTAQKRIWILNRIAEHFITYKDTIEFVFAGTMQDELSSIVKENWKVYNEIGEREKMDQLIKRSHIVILTSAFEGFPLIVKEGMAHGCVPLVTALPGNRTHLSHLSNALLIENPENENSVMIQAINLINELTQNKSLLSRLSQSAFQYAKNHFSKEEFLDRYRKLLQH